MIFSVTIIMLIPEHDRRHAHSQVQELTVEVGVRTRGNGKRAGSCQSATDYSQTVRLSLNGTGVQAWLREYQGHQACSASA